MCMTHDEYIRIMKYRERHKRCRTCEYAIEGGMYWHCKVKNKDGNTFYVSYAGLSGMFCKVYKAKDILDDGK